MSALHETGRWIVLALVVLHVLAIAAYRLAWNVRLAGAMVHGTMAAPPGTAARRAGAAWLALLLLAACAGAVYVLVAIVPVR